MFFSDPLGLALLAFLPAFSWILLRQWRRRRVEVSAYPVLRAGLEALPLLPRSHLWRRRAQTVLLLLAVALLGLAAGGPVVGSESSAPLRVVLLLDHLAPGAGAAGGEAAWKGVLAAAGRLVGSLRDDDRVLLARADAGTLPGGFLAPARAADALERQGPSEIPLDPAASASLIRLLGEIHRPEAVFVATAAPGRWRELPRGGPPVHLVAAPAAPAAPNLAILDVEARPDLLHPQRLELFCRVGAFSPGGEEVEARLRVLNDGRPLRTETLRLAPGVPRAVVLGGLDTSPGLLSIELEPGDGFPADNVYRTPVRDRAFLSATLVTPGNLYLESALRALPGLNLTVRGPDDSPPETPPAVAVRDNLGADEGGGNLLLIRPPRSGADLLVRGELLRPGEVEAEPGEPVLQGVSFAGAAVGKMAVILPPPSYRVVAKAGGYPLVLLGRTARGRRVAVLAFDPVEAGWVHDPSFPILVANLVAWLGEEVRGGASAYRVGDPVSSEVLRRAAELVSPDGQVVRRPAGGWDRLPLPLAGTYRVRGVTAADSGEIAANLLSEEVSRGAAAAGGEPGDPLPTALFPRPFRAELRRGLLAAAVALLALEALVAPPRLRGRLPA